MLDIHVDRIKRIAIRLPDDEQVIALPIVKYRAVVFPAKQSEREFAFDRASSTFAGKRVSEEP